jgi:hypothetical protein
VFPEDNKLASMGFRHGGVGCCIAGIQRCIVRVWDFDARIPHQITGVKSCIPRRLTAARPTNLSLVAAHLVRQRLERDDDLLLFLELRAPKKDGRALLVASQH